jgi:hypothetical protein
VTSLGSVSSRASPRAGGSADLRGWAPLIALQLECSLLERTSDGELIPMDEALGLGVCRGARCAAETAPVKM